MIISSISLNRFRNIIIASFLLLLLIGIGNSIQAQSFDHEAYPKLDFDFQSLELDLGIQPQNLRIDGAATYQLTANVSQADTVILYAAHMDISSVTVNENSVDYSLHDDSLLVPLAEPAKIGQQYRMRIRYSANPKFGLLKSANGSVWASQLPKGERHWVPIVDNPHVEFKTTFNISVPSGFQVRATGKKTGEEAVSVDVIKYSFVSQAEVPATGLSLAIGEFEQDSITSNGTNITVAAEQSLADSVDIQQLLGQADNYINTISDSVGVPYPYEKLDIVVMNDHLWETKSWAASTIYLYQNHGNWNTQLLRGIAAQWFGIYQREIQWKESDAVTLYQTLLTQMQDSSLTLAKNDQPDNEFSTVYSGFGVQKWNEWQKGWQNWQSNPLKNVIASTKSSVLQNLSPVISWKDYAEFWYQQSGQPLFESPTWQYSVESPEQSTEPKDSVAYKVMYNLDGPKGQLKLRFEALYGVYKELTTINAYEIYPNSTDTTEVTFTGKADSVMLQVEPMISTLRLEAPDRPGLYLNEYKPARFLLHELRNAESTKVKTEAARKLGFHTDNPDLQLAINDLMDQELAPKVRAALLSSLADITKGAAGTEDTFLQALSSEHQTIRNAALMALQNYKNNPKVRQRVEQVAQNADTFERFQKATEVIMALSTAEQFQVYAESVIQQDSVGHRSILVIQKLANMGQVDQAVKKAGLFTVEDYNYAVRSRALGILIQHDHTPSDWLSRAQELLQAADPRIRFLTVRGLERNMNKEIQEMLTSYIQDEYDARVYHRIEQILQ